jgi:hypothetical protein
MATSKETASGLTQAGLRALLSYDPETGAFTRRSTDRVTGSPNRTRGYVYVSIGCKAYLAHRLAFLWMTGEWPAAEVDHINRDRFDNRWNNLRPATRQENCGNARGKKAGKVKGVYVDKRRINSPYFAAIGIDGKLVHLGTFSTAELAHAAYCAKAAEVYGQFAA